MINFLLGILGVAVAIAIFKTIDKALTNCSIGKVYNKDGKEIFSWAKFKNGMFNILSSVEWAKSLKEVIDFRKLIIYLLIGASIFTFAWYRGRLGAPVKLDVQGKEAYIRLNGEFLHITSNGEVFVEDKVGNKIKQIAVKDIPALKKMLKPVGLILEPIAVLGYGVSDRGRGAVETGCGFSFIKFWKWRLDAFITNYPACYLGTSYKLDGIGLKNSTIGIGIGKGLRDWKLDQSETRAIIYISVRF